MILQGGCRLAQGQAGDTRVSGGQLSGQDMLKTTGCEINDFLLPGLLLGHAGRGTGLSLQEGEDAFAGYKFYRNR